MKLEMYETSEADWLTEALAITADHIGSIWIDSDGEPCVCAMLVMHDKPLRAAVGAILLINGKEARFPIYRAPIGTRVILEQEAAI